MSAPAASKASLGFGSVALRAAAPAAPFTPPGPITAPPCPVRNLFSTERDANDWNARFRLNRGPAVLCGCGWWHLGGRK